MNIRFKIVKERGTGWPFEQHTFKYGNLSHEVMIDTAFDANRADLEADKFEIVAQIYRDYANREREEEL